MIKSMRKIPFLMVCWFFTVSTVQAQSNNVANNPYSQVSIASPTAGSLGKYADIPVNYHTGIPQISIPIYTVKAGSLTLPISVSYHASGLKVMEPASWVGAGWALNAGGVITRTVVGAPDERGTNNAGTESNGYYSDYGYNNYLYQTNPPPQATTPQDWQAIANGWKDGEPDLYFFNFNNYTGKFYFNDDHTPVIVPAQDLKIVPTYTGSGSIQGFLITTPDGVQYSFGNIGGATNATEITNPVTAQNGSSTGTAVSSWYLNQIASADSKFSIALTYATENYGYFTIAMFPVDGTSNSNEYNLVKNVVQGKRLSQISFPNGTVTFNSGSVRTDLSDATATLSDATNTQAYTLGNIQIKDTSTFCKQFNFTYGYFTDNTSPLNGSGITTYSLQTDKSRLRLDKVQEVSCDNSLTVPPYQFSYFSEMVPRRLTFGQDHWGFYNGVTNNQTLIPTYTLYGSNNYSQTYTGATRDPAWPAMRGGALQQITYPTGGYTSFDYGYNDTYTSYSVYEEVTMCTLVAHEYGQSALSQTLSFATTGGGTCEIIIHNTSTNYSPTFVITNSSNQQVYNSGLINFSSTLDFTMSLPDGTYTATLSFPSNSGGTLINGADAILSQYRYVTISGNKMIGGLHINTITHNDGITSNNIVTSYNYQTNGQSNSILYSRPAYVGIVRNDLIAQLGYWTPNNGFQSQNLVAPGGCTTTPDAFYFKSPVSIRPMGTTQGYPIGYSRVTVSQTGNGSSVYDYWGSYNGSYGTNTSDIAITTLNKAGCDASQPNYPAAPLPFEFTRGELKHEWHYDQSGNLLQDIAYTPTYTTIAATTPGFIVVWRGNQLLGTNYNIVNAKKTQMVTVKTDNTPGVGSVMTTTTDTYGSAFHNGVTSHSVVTSTGDNITSNMKYAWDFRVANCDAIADGWSTYTSACSSCLTTYNNANAHCSGNSSCITTAYLNYMQCTDAARVNYVTYRRQNFIDPNNTFQQYHTAAEGNADGELKPILLLQDEFKNPVLETSNYKNSNLTSASFNRFDYGLNGSTFVYPNKLQTLFPTTLATTFTNAAVSGSTISKDSRYMDEAFYKFNGGNPVEATGKDGVTTSYLWGYNNVLPIAKAVGTDYATLSAAYTSAGNSLTALRSQSSISGAQLSTYTYLPILGMTGQTDASSKTVTYEYDKLGRLVVIRDQWGNVVKKYDYQYLNTGQ